MKEKFLKHKKKLIGAILIVAGCFFPPIQALIPEITAIISAVEISSETNAE